MLALANNNSIRRDQRATVANSTRIGDENAQLRNARQSQQHAVQNGATAVKRVKAHVGNDVKNRVKKNAPQHAALRQQATLPTAKPAHAVALAASSNYPSVLPRLQLVYSCSSAMVDWLGIQCSLYDGVVQHCVDVKQLLMDELDRQASFTKSSKTLRKVYNAYNTYDLVTPRCSVRLIVRHDTSLEISANPTMFTQGFNEFCTTDPFLIVKKLLYIVQQQLHEFYGARHESSSLAYKDVSLTRIDITQMIDCGSAPVAAATFSNMRLHLIALGFNRRPRDVTVEGNTLYFGQHSHAYSLSMYRVSLKEKPKILPEADRWIRVELMLRSSEIKSLLDTGEWTPDNLNHVLQDYIGQLHELFRQWRPSHVGQPPKWWPADLLAHWYCWVGGADVPHLTGLQLPYEQAAPRMRALGVNLAVPPTPRRSRKLSAHALTLKEFLDPARYDADGHTAPALVKSLGGSHE